VVDPTLRVLPDDAATDDVVRLPGEAALATWTAHRCHLRWRRCSPNCAT
jgi:hypothetical protein